MKTKITMGNDEFILYIRKNYNCSLTNDRIGRMVWKWIHENSKGIDKEKDIKHNIPCLWQKHKTKTYGIGLPQTASQITFNRKLLPKLYGFLDELGQNYGLENPYDVNRRKEEEEIDMPELDF